MYTKRGGRAAMTLVLLNKPKIVNPMFRMRRAKSKRASATLPTESFGRDNVEGERRYVAGATRDVRR